MNKAHVVIYYASDGSSVAGYIELETLTADGLHQLGQRTDGLIDVQDPTDGEITVANLRTAAKIELR